MKMNEKKKRRILIFSTAYYPFIGGAEVAIKEITDRLGKHFEFDLITSRFDKKLPLVETIGNVRVYRVGVGSHLRDKLTLPFWGAYRAVKLLQHERYFCFWGVMVTFGSGAGFVANIFRMMTGKKKIPMVLSLQEGDSESHLRYRWGGLIGLSWWLALRNTDFLTGLSTFLLHRAERIGYAGRSMLIPNGVDVKVFSRKILVRDREEMRNRLQKKDTEVFLVTTSRLTRKNAVDDIISALTFLPAHVTLLVIGRGEEGPKLSELAHKLGVKDRVKFIGFVPQREIPTYFSVCDIFVRPSRSEGFGNSFIEAMAAGLPVIATPVGGIPDFIDDKETGLFCAPDNPKSLAQAVSILLDDNALRAKIIAKARERVLARYSWEHIAEKLKTSVFDVI